jgi:hypothetical protein
MSLADLKPAEVFSVIASVGSLAATGYFWLVRANKEKPRLQTHLVAVDDVGVQQDYERGWDPFVLVRIAVVNLSTLPNVVLRTRVWVQKSGGVWAESGVYIQDGGTNAFNVAPQVAEFRTVRLVLPQMPKPSPLTEEWSKLTWRQALEQAVGGPLVFKVELGSLDDRTFTDIIPLPA